MKLLMTSAVALTTMVGAAAAATTTVTFNTPGANAFSLTDVIAGTGGVSYTATADANGFLNPNGAAPISQNSNGLGVVGSPDTDPGNIDSFPFSAESITVTFSQAVNLLSFDLGAFSGNDDYSLYINGSLVGSNLTQDPNVVNLIGVLSFTVEASYALFTGDGLGNDEFTLSSFKVAAVPVPAAGLLLLGGLGGLAALRRRKAA